MRIGKQGYDEYWQKTRGGEEKYRKLKIQRNDDILTTGKTTLKT